MSPEPICLTAEEIEGLRELLAFLAVLEERGFEDDRQMIEVTALVWRDMTAGPKRKLSRLTRHRVISALRSPADTGEHQEGDVGS